MKKPNLGPDKGTTGKELSKSPFKKIGNDLQSEVEHFHKLITKIVTKHPLAPEAEMLIAFEKELGASKDPVGTWIKANALEQLGYNEIAAKFKEKATLLGYKIDSVMETLSIEDALSVEVKLNGRIIDTATINGELWKKIKALLHLNPPMPKLEGKKIKLIAIKENVENIAAGTEGTIIKHDEEADIISVKWDNGETTPILPDDKFEVLGEAHQFPCDVEDLLNPKLTQHLPLEDATKLTQGNELSSQSEQPLEDQPEYDKSALIWFIENDPFYKFTFHETATEDQDKDLEKFYKHYVKGDDKNEHILKAYTRSQN